MAGWRAAAVAVPEQSNRRGDQQLQNPERNTDSSKYDVLRRRIKEIAAWEHKAETPPTERFIARGPREMTPTNHLPFDFIVQQALHVVPRPVPVSERNCAEPVIHREV